ncbi:MAG: DUF454 family protein [Plesiomonas sp.]|uniref:DUF454 family protein n=1 Tax=Plesiomonas sp. TaxID=2486279 RepID=UPI003F2CE832
MRWFYIATGCLAVILGVIGVILPLLPTTPFLLLALACFARSSPRCHDWLMYRSPFAVLLQQWQHNRTIPKAAKLRAICFVLCSFAVSIGFVSLNVVKIILVLLCMVILYLLWRIPVGMPK